MGSSKAEQALAKILANHGFHRNYPVYVKDCVKPINVDIYNFLKRIWIESDGIWHFMQVKDGHDFELCKSKDALLEQEALKRNVLLIRVNNAKYNIDQQLAFIFAHIDAWDGVSGKVVCLY